MSLGYPVFPGFKPGQSFTPPGTPVRSPQWNYKESPRFSNYKQQTVNGITRTVKYWPNPLRTFEWRYGYIYDDPSGIAYGLGLNQFYPEPIPATDFETLNGFFCGMQGTGTQFLFQPPDYVVGQSLTITAIEGTSDEFTIFYSGTVPPIRAGLYAVFSGIGTFTALNGQSLQVLYTGPNSVTVWFSHANYAKTADTGTMKIGQLLTVDANNNAELRHLIGSYPTIPLTGTPPAVTMVTESVQVIDSTTLSVLAAGSAAPSYTLEAADTIANYPGLVLSFSSTPSPPVVALFNYYYICRFAEDMLEFENFLTMLYLCSKISFEQDRI
jgi:hypothetical protein